MLLSVSLFSQNVDSTLINATDNIMPKNAIDSGNSSLVLENPVSENLTNLDNLTGRELEESTPYVSQTVNSGATENSTASSVWLFVRVILVLAVVIAAIYGFIWILKKTSKTPDGKDSYLRHTAALSIGQGKSVHVVTLGDKGYLLGVSDSSVQLIAPVEDKELIQAMNLLADSRTDTKTNFSDLLSQMMPFFKKQQNKTFASNDSSQDEKSSSEKDFGSDDFILRQRKRLQEISNKTNKKGPNNE